MIDECAAGLEAIGVLPRCAGLLTGYLGRPEIGEAALRALTRIRAANPEAAYACDPVIGDVGRGSYVAAGVAEFFRDRALPLATIATPNAFELEWLTGGPAGNPRPKRQSAIAALRARGPRVVVAKSLSLDDTPADALDMLACDERGLWRLRTPKLPIAVNGAGDLFAALFFHHWLELRLTPEALSRTASSVFAIVAATLAAGTRELAIVADQEELSGLRKSFGPRRSKFNRSCIYFSAGIVAKVLASSGEGFGEGAGHDRFNQNAGGGRRSARPFASPAPRMLRQFTVMCATRPPLDM